MLGLDERGQQTGEYRAWRDMHTRCRNPNARNYYNYGGRGIVVCERWSRFAPFLKDMGFRPSPKHTLERRDNAGDYTPENCRWATRKEQARNRRTSRFLTLNGQTKSVVEWAEHTGIPQDVLRKRLRMKWPTERVLTSPIDVRYQR